MTDDEPITIASIRRLDICEGDTLVLRLSEPRTRDAICQIREQWLEQVAHLNVKTIIVAHDMEVTIIREADLEDATQ